MTIPKVRTIQTSGAWELIETIYNQNGVMFWPSADIEFSTKLSPAVDEILPIKAEKKNRFSKPTSFYVRGTVGTKIYLAPFSTSINAVGLIPPSPVLKSIQNGIVLVANTPKVVIHNLNTAKPIVNVYDSSTLNGIGLLVTVIDSFSISLTANVGVTVDVVVI